MMEKKTARDSVGSDGGVIVKYTPYRHRRRRGDLPIDRARLIRRQQNGRGRATTAITVVDNPDSGRLIELCRCRLSNVRFFIRYFIVRINIIK